MSTARLARAGGQGEGGAGRGHPCANPGQGLRPADRARPRRASRATGQGRGPPSSGWVRSQDAELSAAVAVRQSLIGGRRGMRLRWQRRQRRQGPAIGPGWAWRRLWFPGPSVPLGTGYQARLRSAHSSASRALAMETRPPQPAPCRVLRAFPTPPCSRLPKEEAHGSPRSRLTGQARPSQAQR